MRHYAWTLPIAMSIVAPLHAQEPEEARFEEKLVVDPGRVPGPEPTEEAMTFAFRGEYQLRLRAFSDLPLQERIGQAPGSDLGQNAHLVHWLRLSPRFLYRDVLQLVGEIDFPRGFIAGPPTVDVDAARDDFAERKPYEVRPRALYLQYITPIGLLRVGHQPSHWGMGLLANDGAHASLFGDYRRGSIVERLLFATRPAGKDTPLVIAAAGDLVYEDARAELLEGDRAVQGVLALRWEEERWNIGLYGVFRHQERDSESVDEKTPFTEDLTIGAIDMAGAFNSDIPGIDGYLFGEFEVAMIGGNTTLVRNIDLTRGGDEEDILSFGGAAKLGAVVTSTADDGTRFGRAAFAFEYGYASGDADPYDGVTRRFTFDQNHNVGLVLFDHVLAWKTARAATIAQDTAIVNRPSPGLQFVPTEGSIFGAQYVNPTLVVRPLHWIDIKTGVVVAQTSADFVDPFQAGALGNYANYDGGDDGKHDLGLELDLGLEVRLHATGGLIVNAGVEGGVLFPGNAFDDEAGNRLQTQYLLNSKLGMSF